MFRLVKLTIKLFNNTNKRISNLKSVNPTIQITQMTSMTLQNKYLQTPRLRTKRRGIKRISVANQLQPGRKYFKYILRNINCLFLFFRPITDLRDDFRHPDAHKDGGFPLNDAAVIANYRNAFKDIVKQLGKTIFSGKFNIGSVSFPISCMSHQSIIYLIATMSIHAPIYMTRAALATDPVERMKFVLTTSLSFLQPCHVFNKPLNPILGETLQAKLDDGSNIFLEQICHHPPISYISHEGPDQIYRWSGYSCFTSRVHMNSIDLDVKGGKTITFKDGGKITYTPH